MGDATHLLDPLEASPRTLRDALTDGSYACSTQDLPFMAIINTTEIGLWPFKLQPLRDRRDPCPGTG